ncbi:MAG: site-2 protease family protein [Planctomycetes bacterium]|nr:site-2 protease family protein [Planctomycetota bacterium]
MFLSAEPSATPYDVRFSLFGVPIRIHPLFWLFSVLMGLNLRDPGLVFIWVVACLLALLAHEFGHIAAMRYFDERGYIILHAFGGLAVSRARVQRPTLPQVVVSLAGPFAGFLFALAIYGVLFAAGRQPSWAFSPTQGIDVSFEPVAPAGLNALVVLLLEVNIYWGVLNLLPILPLDGGNVSLALFTEWRSREGVIRALQVSIATAAIVGGYAYFITRDFFLPMFFGFLGFNNYQLLQSISNRGDRPW